ncbi:hypothetical protein BDD12DRAFT_890437 [Trichophaea hybrida]|nr:hypothetical protein BDD12DRAFT_890437 [Trichophaea hybrida]
MPESIPTNDTANLLVLRRDLRSTFDRNIFVFVSKGAAFYVHFLIRTPDFCPIYYNRKVSGLNTALSSQFIFARFAWVIFLFAKEFIKTTGPREALY